MQILVLVFIGRGYSLFHQTGPRVVPVWRAKPSAPERGEGWGRDGGVPSHRFGRHFVSALYHVPVCDGALVHINELSDDGMQRMFAST